MQDYCLLQTASIHKKAQQTIKFFHTGGIPELLDFISIMWKVYLSRITDFLGFLNYPFQVHDYSTL